MRFHATGRIRAARLVATVVVVAAGAACGEGSDDADPPLAHDEATSCAPSGPHLTIAADDVLFDKRCLAAPAGQAFEIAFENKEAVAHNVAILASHDSTDAMFSGQTFSGPRTMTYSVHALAAGTYHFHCSVHPQQMMGTFIVG